jgi:hypothetical protein
VTVLLAPVAESPPKRLGPRVFRKQVLRPMDLDYRGRRIRFDEPYFVKLVRAFKDQAFDSVPFMLADSSNRHTMAPERAAGEVLGLEAAPDGLYATIRLSEHAADIVAEHPRFGVSARIVEGLRRGDGYHADAAIQHVLGTFDPYVPKLAPWQEAELSAGDHDVIDLTRAKGDVMAAPMEGLNEEQARRLEVLLSMPAERFAELTGEQAEDETELSDADFAELFAETPAEQPVPPPPEEGDGDETDDGEQEDDEPGSESGTYAGAGALALSEDGGGLELSAALERLATVEDELALARWNGERAELAARGVPPAMLDAAAGVLARPAAAVVELSNGESVDAASVIRRILDSAAGYVDLSAEIGHDRGGTRVDETDTEYLHAMADNSGLLGRGE